MDKYSENKLVMLRAVMSFLMQNKAIWQESVPIVEAVNELKSLILQIEENRQIAMASSAGFVTEKHKQQEILIEKLYELSSMLFAYAVHTGDTVLQSKVDFRISDLKNLRDGELALSCRNVLALGLAHEAPMVEYNIGSDKLNTIQTLITKYEQNVPAHRVTVSERKTANEKIKTLLESALRITYDQIDRLMVQFKSTVPDFYASYMNARKIVNYGIRHEKKEPKEPTV